MRSSTDSTGAEVAMATSRELTAEVIQDAERLVALEVDLAKREIKDLVITNAVAAAMMASGGLLVALALLVALPSLAVILVPAHAEAAAAWLAAYLVVGAVLMIGGKSRFRIELPARTIASLKENKKWVLQRIRSTDR